MKKAVIHPSSLSGQITVPPSKSAAHRNIICAALASGTSRIYPECHSDDIDATLSAVQKLGAKAEIKNGAFYITGIGKTATETGDNNLSNGENKYTNSESKSANDESKSTNSVNNSTNCIIDCNESGSTLRFMLPVAAALGVQAEFNGSGRLPNRPISPITEVLRQNGVFVSADSIPLNISGKLKNINFEISGDISSQYLTGLLLALPLIGGGKIKLTTPLQSAGYVDLTIKIMNDFGVTVTKSDNVYIVSGEYKARQQKIEGDWSQACFFMAAGAMGANITLNGLDNFSVQGDRQTVEIFRQLGADITLTPDGIIIKKGESSPVKIDCSQIPDAVPALAAAAVFSNGKTEIYGAERLRIKESDRIKTTVAALKAMGVCVTENEDGLTVEKSLPKSGIIDGANDHRIVMAFSILAAFSSGKTEISYAEAVKKSYPEFFKDYKKMGGKADVISMGE